MKDSKLLATLALVAGLFGASAKSAGIGDLRSYEPDDLSLSSSDWTNEEKGREGFLTSSHILGGYEAPPYSFPYQLVLFAKGERNFVREEVLCGGTLITDSWVLTAAHCVDKKYIFEGLREEDSCTLEVFASAGVHNISQFLNLIKVTNVQVNQASDIIIHPEWDIIKLKNDIALLRLETYFVLNEYVYPIRLPKLSQQSESFVGSAVTMTGWGIVNRKKMTDPDTLQALDTKVVSNFYCSFRYFFKTVTDTNLCTSGSRGEGGSLGDSGGPLILKEADGVPTLIGITSFSSSAWWAWRIPTAFTRVTSYLNWIHNNTGILLRI